eukprot:3145774-Pyramimonas_sp.AAC.1
MPRAHRLRVTASSDGRQSVRQVRSREVHALSRQERRGANRGCLIQGQRIPMRATSQTQTSSFPCPDT